MALQIHQALLIFTNPARSPELHPKADGIKAALKVSLTLYVFDQITQHMLQMATWHQQCLRQVQEKYLVLCSDNEVFLIMN